MILNQCAKFSGQYFLRNTCRCNKLRLYNEMVPKILPAFVIPSTCSIQRMSSFGTRQPATEEGNGFFNYIKTHLSFSFKKDAIKREAYTIYHNISSNIDFKLFFQTFNMPDTFNSWFLVMELHVWMLMIRLMDETREGRLCRNGIVEALWVDCSARAKKLAPGNPSVVKKQLNELSEQFQAALLTYDEGIQSDDIVLTSALWYRFFEKNCNDPRHLEVLVAYVRQTLHDLSSISNENLINIKKVKWTPLTQHINAIKLV